MKDRQTNKYSKIRELFEFDQELRLKFRANEISLDDFNKAESKILTNLKRILSTENWSEILNSEVADNFFVLVLHADDINFQKQVLDKIKGLKKITKHNWLAYLEDKIRVQEGREQLYGTQFYKDDSGIHFFEIEDKKNLDKRRREKGLESFEEYNKKIMTN